MDEQPPDQPTPDSPENKGPDLISEDELEAALAEASALASDLSEQVGADGTPAAPAESAEEPAASTDSDETPAQSDKLPTDLDAELVELERLIAVAESDVGQAPDPADETASPPQEPAAAPDEPAPQSEEAAAPSDESVSLGEESGSVSAEPAAPSAEPAALQADSDIPDFMDELTRPEESDAAKVAEPLPPPSKPVASAETTPQGERDADGPSSEATSPRPGVVGTGTVGVVGTVSQAPEADPVEAAATRDKPDGPSSTSGNTRKVPEVIRVASARLAPHVLTVCERGVTILELIDRPLGRISQPIRRPIGWVALATTGAASILYLYSLL